VVKTSGPHLRGRGATFSPPNRFERLRYESDDHFERTQDDDLNPAPRTEFLRDDTQSILAYNQSPDIGFDVSLNPYRGCEHGCTYCYARPTHEYLGFSAGLDFESRILVKERAPELLRKELDAPGWNPQVIAMSGITDCYQPIERKLALTRACLEVLCEFRNPAFLITKNRLITRDTDLLSQLATWHAVGVTMSVTTLDPDLAGRMEPRASLPAARLEAIRELAEAGIPVGVNVAPIIPGLNDHEIANILAAAKEAGAQFAFYTMIRLPLTVAPVFSAWLHTHFPDSAEKILGRIRSIRNGRLNDARYGSRMRGEGPLADQVRQLFEVARRRVRLGHRHLELCSSAFRRAQPGQLELFG
jgi:DNA repair photolyase